MKATKSTFYNIVVAAAYSITASPSGIVFSFLPKHKMVKEQADAQKPLLQSIAERLAGQPVPVSIVFTDASESAPVASASAREQSGELRRDLAGAASGREGGPAAPDAQDAPDPMSNATVQAVLEIFPVEKTTVEER